MPYVAREKIVVHRRNRGLRIAHNSNVNKGSQSTKGNDATKKAEEQIQTKNNHIEAIKKLASKVALTPGDGNKYIVLTVGNLGYMSLLVNWWLSVNRNTNLAEHSMVLTYDSVLVDNLRKRVPFCNAGYLPYTIPNTKAKPSERAVAFKKNGWDGITRFKLSAIHYLIEWGYTVYYLDPDVYLINNSLERLNGMINGETKMLIQQGKPFCSGVIYAPPNEVTKHVFAPKEWQSCGMDDEHYIGHFFNTKYPNLRKHVSVLSLDRFPNGLKWKTDYTVDHVWSQIKKNEVDLLHFNYVSGIENKIAKMRNYRMWHKQMTIVNVPSQFQPDLNETCLRKNKSVYPPHQSGPQIESYTYKFMKDYLKNKTISSDYDYLPIFWTAISLDENPRLIDNLKSWLRDYINRYPNHKCWTVVQHCKGIQRSCGLVLPKSWKIFSTSDPNAIRINDDKSNPSIPMNFPPLRRRKVVYWNKGYGRQTARPSDRPRDRKGMKHIPNKAVETVDDNPSPLQENKNRTFYVKNHTTIPLLSSKHNASKQASWTGKRKLLASFIGNLTVHPVRKAMNETLSKRDRVLIEAGKYKSNSNVTRFDELMLNSTFALCPRGYGNTSFRLVEAMQFGTIPVYISDVFSLPYEDVIDWNKIAVLITPNQYPKMYQILADIEKDQEKVEEYRKNIKELLNKYFTMDGCCTNIIRYITMSV